MGFAAGEKEEREEIKVKRVVEIPQYKTVEVERPVFKERKIEIIKPEFKRKIIEKPVYREVTVEKPIFEKKVIKVEKVKVIEKIKIVEVPKYVEKIIEEIGRAHV